MMKQIKWLWVCCICLLLSISAFAVSSAETYTPKGPFAVPRVFQVLGDGKGDCHLNSYVSVQAYMLGSYSYGGYSRVYNGFTDYTYADDPLYHCVLDYFGTNAIPSYAASYLEKLPYPMNAKANISLTEAMTKLYEQLSLGHPAVIYDGPHKKHASVVVGYRGTANQLKLSDFTVMEIAKSGTVGWQNSSYHAANPSTTHGSGEGWTYCYSTMDSWLDWDNKGSRATTLTLTYPTGGAVGAPGAPVISTDKDTYVAGETATISLSHTSAGLTSQYMQFVHKDSNTYLYNQNSTGVFTHRFVLEQPGTYKVLYQIQNHAGGSPGVSREIKVIEQLPVPTITTDKDAYVVGETLTVTLGGTEGSSSQYMQFYHLESGTYFYNQVSTGVYQHQFELEQAGTYKILYQTSCQLGTSTPVSKVITVANALPKPTITTDKETYEVGETVTITFGNTEGSTSQYMQFYHIDSSTYLYNQNSTGVFVHRFVVNEPGQYKILYQTHNSQLASEPVQKTISVVEEVETVKTMTLSAEGTVRCCVGDQFRITFAITPADASEQICWSSSDSSVASVKDGVVTVWKNGTATITAVLESDDRCGASVDLKVGGNCYILPDQAALLKSDAFANNTQLEMLVLPTLQSLRIEENALDGCTRLTTIYAGSNDVTIAEDALPADAVLTFVCPQDSAAHLFAMENGYQYLLLE